MAWDPAHARGRHGREYFKMAFVGAIVLGLVGLLFVARAGGSKASQHHVSTAQTPSSVAIIAGLPGSKPSTPAPGGVTSGGAGSAPGAASAGPPPSDTGPPPAPAPAPPGQSGPPHYTISDAVTHDCSVDVTAALTWIIASIPDNAVIDFVPGGCYRIDGTLNITNRDSLTLDGHNATFRPFTDGTEFGGRHPGRNRCQWSVITSNNITLQNMIVHGANPNGGVNGIYDANLEAQHAFQLGASSGITLNNVQGYDTYGDLVYIGGVNNALIENSTFAHNGRQGWTINGGSNITFNNNNIFDIRRTTIDMEPADTGNTDGLVISNNTFGLGRFALMSVGGAATTINNVSILNNQVHRGFSLHLSLPGSGSNWHIVGNIVSGPVGDTGISQSGGGAIFAQNITGLYVANNYALVQPGRGITGVNLSNDHNVAVTSNIWDSADGSISYYDNLSGNVCYSGNQIGSPPGPEDSPNPCP